MTNGGCEYMNGGGLFPGLNPVEKSESATAGKGDFFAVCEGDFTALIFLNALDEFAVYEVGFMDSEKGGKQAVVFRIP